MEMKRPTVLLVIPRYFSTDLYGYIIPMGIMYVSAALKKSDVANVLTVNLNHEDKDYESVLRRIIVDNNVDIVGCGGISGQFIEIYPLFETVRRIAPHVKNIVGGGMITADAETAMKAFGDIVDYGVIGEGEITVPALVQTIAEDGNPGLVEGIIYPDENGGFIITKPRMEIQDLDSLPLPDYKGFNYDKYLSTNGEWQDGKKFSPVAIIGGRSCKYACTFCFHPSGSRYRQRSLDSIFHEIDYLIEHYNINYIALREELFASDVNRVLEFCRRSENYSIVWSIQLRVDSINREMVKTLAKSKCRYVFLGIESADNRILKSMRKHITVEQVENALNLCLEYGLDTRSTIIIGDEEETIESTETTLNWWLAHKKKWAIDLGLIIAFPGSTLYKHAIADGRIPDPVQFLRDGCPIINLSKHLTYSQFRNIQNRITNYTQIKFNITSYID
jgi:radical SAM superfamily enzyme YgiQ (UPF0313 family)